MPQGKRAGERCVQLRADESCAIFGRPERPAVCVRLRASDEMCRNSRAEALAELTALEQATQPDPAGKSLR